MGFVRDLRTKPRNMKEGFVASAIEERTAALPSDVYLWLAGGSIIGSLVCEFTNRKQLANFIGHWAPTFLSLGIYNKIVKTLGHD